MTDKHEQGRTTWCASVVFRQGISRPQPTTIRRRAFYWPGQVSDEGEGQKERAMDGGWDRTEAEKAMSTAPNTGKTGGRREGSPTIFPVG